MKRRGILGGMLLMAAAAQAGHTVHWGYMGEEGPDRWGQLSPAYSSCANGRNQSPVDLKGFIEAELPPLARIFHQKERQNLFNPL